MTCEKCEEERRKESDLNKLMEENRQRDIRYNEARKIREEVFRRDFELDEEGIVDNNTRLVYGRVWRRRK